MILTLTTDFEKITSTMAPCFVHVPAPPDFVNITATPDFVNIAGEGGQVKVVVRSTKVSTD